MNSKHNKDVLKRILSDINGSDIPDEQVEKFYNECKSNGLSEDLCYDARKIKALKYVIELFGKRW